ncbi:MAG: hypothetical protein KGJ79_18635 [Alphaproteobacteria bacterium]|nr:hypothetical protein [Alphaproteobacteria bacterium]
MRSVDHGLDTPSPTRRYDSANCLNSAMTAAAAAATILAPASGVACDGSEPMRPSGKRRR